MWEDDDRMGLWGSITYGPEDELMRVGLVVSGEKPRVPLLVSRKLAQTITDRGAGGADKGGLDLLEGDGFAGGVGAGGCGSVGKIHFYLVKGGGKAMNGGISRPLMVLV